MKTPSVLILGAGGHGQVVADIFSRAEDAGGAWRTAGFLDDDQGLGGQRIGDCEVIGSLDELDRVAHDGVIVAIGDNRTRARVLEMMRGRGEVLVNAIHPAAVVADSASIREGVMVCAGAIINPDVSIADGVILNTASTVDHHSSVGACAHLAPGVHLGGEVEICEGAFLGIGAVVAPRCRIGAWATVGAGAAVVEDVPAGVTVVGVPARTLQ